MRASKVDNTSVEFIASEAEGLADGAKESLIAVCKPAFKEHLPVATKAMQAFKKAVKGAAVVKRGKGSKSADENVPPIISQIFEVTKKSALDSSGVTVLTFADITAISEDKPSSFDLSDELAEEFPC